MTYLLIDSKTDKVLGESYDLDTITLLQAFLLRDDTLCYIRTSAEEQEL